MLRAMPPDPRERALLTEILANPDDDAPRMVYADHCEERGDDARASLIRAQLRAADRTLSEAEREAAQEAAAQIEEIHGARLAGDLARRVSRWRFERGFVSAVTADLLTFAAQLEALRAMAPIETWTLEHGDDDIATELRVEAATRLAATPQLAAIRAIDAALGSFSAAPLAALLASPHLAKLFSLVLGIDASARSIALIAAAPLPGLRVLRCFAEFASVGDRGAMVLASSALWPQLEVLELWGCAIGAAGVAALCAAANPQLRHLAIGATAYASNSLGAIGASALASARWPALEILELPGARLGDDGVAALAGAPWLAQVARLSLDDNAIGGRGLAALAGARALEELSIDDNPVSEVALASLAALPRLRRVYAHGAWRTLR